MIWENGLHTNKDWNVPCSIERSRSGNGAHVWIFFEQPLPASKARRLGNTILTEATERYGRMGFKSYDRFFPNQDRLPDGGFGNLVAYVMKGYILARGRISRLRPKKTFFVAGVFHMPLLRNFRISGVA